jgi:hypothetical protein
MLGSRENLGGFPQRIDLGNERNAMIIAWVFLKIKKFRYRSLLKAQRAGACPARFL